MTHHKSSVLALLLAFGLFWSYSAVTEHLRGHAPASDWFIVRQLFISDFPHGHTGAPVVYDRLIIKPFNAQWVVEITDAATKGLVCTGSGANHYDVRDQLPDTGVTFEWFVGKDCHLPPGQYIARAYWRIFPKGYPEKEQSITSNVFTVTPN